jgi:hypothetical protein
VSDPVCVCGRCWSRDRANDPKAWPSIPPWRTWTHGTIRVALPCVLLVDLGMGRRIEVESECEFWGHSLTEALGKAGSHRRAGAKLCKIAVKHAEDFVLPDGAGTR